MTMSVLGGGWHGDSDLRFHRIGRYGSMLVVNRSAALNMRSAKDMSNRRHWSSCGLLPAVFLRGERHRLVQRCSQNDADQKQYRQGSSGANEWIKKNEDEWPRST
jgi:hypothetical protein